MRKMPTMDVLGDFQYYNMNHARCLNVQDAYEEDSHHSDLGPRLHLEVPNGMDGEEKDQNIGDDVERADGNEAADLVAAGAGNGRVVRRGERAADEKDLQNIADGPQQYERNDELGTFPQPAVDKHAQVEAQDGEFDRAYRGCVDEFVCDEELFRVREQILVMVVS